MKLAVVILVLAVLKVAYCENKIINVEGTLDVKVIDGEVDTLITGENGTNAAIVPNEDFRGIIITQKIVFTIYKVTVHWNKISSNEFIFIGNQGNVSLLSLEIAASAEAPNFININGGILFLKKVSVKSVANQPLSNYFIRNELQGANISIYSSAFTGLSGTVILSSETENNINIVGNAFTDIELEINNLIYVKSSNVKISNNEFSNIRTKSEALFLTGDLKGESFNLFQFFF
jgi:hypothetical protein